MIRWLFLVLIIVNIGIFAWGMQRELRPEEPSRGAGANVPSLVLLSELDTEVEPTAAPSGQSAGQPPLAPPGIPDPPLPEPDAEAGSDLGSAENRDAPPLVSEDTLPAAGAEPAFEGSAAEPSPPEAETREFDLDGEPGPEEATAAAALASEPTCFSIGPFPKRDEAEGLRAALRADALDASVRQEARQKQQGYWVLIPPMASRAEAVAEVDRIKAKGVADVWRFNKGDMANAISLGLFARLSQAETHQRDLERKGIGSEVRPRYLERADYYVDIGPSSDQELESGLAERVDREYPEQTRQAIVCP